MSEELLRTRLTQDLERQTNEMAEILVMGRQMPLDDLRYNQGMIAGLRLAKTLLDERARNLHSMG